MKRADVASGIFWLVLGVFFSVWAISSYDVGGITHPGPGFLPLILGVLMVMLSAMILLKGLRASPAPEQTRRSSLPPGWKKIAYVVLVLLGATFSFETLGYLITVFLLIGFLMAGKQLKSLRNAAITALLTALGVYIVFILLLEQPFPRGLLRF